MEKLSSPDVFVGVSKSFLESWGVCAYCHKEVICRLGEAWHSKGEKVWHETCSYQETIEKLVAENTRLRAVNAELLTAANKVRELIDSGALVRDISHDAEPGWAMKQIPLVMAVQDFIAAIEHAEKADA